jgi:hypothetical protein
LQNENAIELLEYPEKINYANLSVNSSIFIYDYENDEKYGEYYINYNSSFKYD